MRDGRRSREEHAPRDPKPLPPDVKKALFEKLDQKLFGEDPKLKRSAAQVRDAFGTPAFEGAIRKFLEAYGMPKDWDTLMVLVESDEADTVVHALEALAERWGGAGEREREAFRRKLRFLVMAAADPGVGHAARVTLDRIEAAPPAAKPPAP